MNVLKKIIISESGLPKKKGIYRVYPDKCSDFSKPTPFNPDKWEDAERWIDIYAYLI